MGGTTPKSNTNDERDERDLRIIKVEFGAKVKLHWIDDETQETGYTEITPETYQKIFGGRGGIIETIETANKGEL